MILHLLHDDKFGEYAIRQFSEEKMCSEFIVVTHSYAPDCSDKFEGLQTIRADREEFQNLLQHLGDYKAIVLHGLFYPWQESVLRAVPNHVKVAWVFWGGDIYGRKDIAANYLSTSSQWLQRKQDIKRLIKGKKELSRFEIPYELLQRIDYCLTDIPEDFAFVKKYFNSDIKELWYNYYSVEETIGELVNAEHDGDNILLGNSSSLECNHIDGMRQLKKFKLGSSKIVVPLSYGESWIRKAILKKGRRMFGDRFMPLISFIPRPEYNRIIQSCSVVVMPHYRPQAFGNILTALWLGSRFYLSNRNPLLPFFKRIGTVIFSFEDDLSPDNQTSLSPLSVDQMEQNRKIIASIYGRDAMHKKNLEIVNVLNS